MLLEHRRLSPPHKVLFENHKESNRQRFPTQTKTIDRSEQSRREANFYFDVLQFQSNIFFAHTRISFDIFMIDIGHFDTLSIGHQHTSITDSTTTTFDSAHDDHPHLLTEKNFVSWRRGGGNKLSIVQQWAFVRVRRCFD